MQVVQVILRGIGQVMLQNNVLSGILMLIGIAAGDWQAALLALAGNIVGNVAAWWFRYPVREIQEGLYGFNSTLIGIAVGVFFHIGWWSLLLVVSGSIVSTWLMHFFLLIRKPGYTAPFIIATWLLLGVGLLFPSLRQTGTESLPVVAPHWLQAFSFNVGQVMFQGASVVTGFLFLAGIAVNDRRGAIYALWGAVLPLGVFLLLNDYAAFNAGLYGYNGVLCAIALAGAGSKDFLWATLAVVLSVALQELGMVIGTVTLTAPFVLAVWTVLALKSACRKERPRYKVI